MFCAIPTPPAVPIPTVEPNGFDQINLLQSTFSLGNNWSISKIRAFAYCMAHHSHTKGEYIYRQGEPAQNLYIVFRGKVRAVSDKVQ